MQSPRKFPPAALDLLATLPGCADITGRHVLGQLSGRAWGQARDGHRDAGLGDRLRASLSQPLPSRVPLAMSLGGSGPQFFCLQTIWGTIPPCWAFLRINGDFAWMELSPSPAHTAKTGENRVLSPTLSLPGEPFTPGTPEEQEGLLNII